MRPTMGLVVAAAMAAVPAYGDPPPAAPDFSDPDLPTTAPGASEGVDRSFAASGTDSAILPSDDVGFALASSRLGADAEATLNLVSHWLAVHPKAHLVIVAHADPTGTVAYNDD